VEEVLRMSLAEVLPNVQSLSRADKLRLIQFLAQDLAQIEESGPIRPDQTYPVWSPHEAFGAAAVLMQALEAERGQP
jgi:hypothetical protein